MSGHVPTEILRCKRLVLGQIWSLGTLPPRWMFAEAGVPMPPEPGHDAREPAEAPPAGRPAAGRPQRRKPGPAF